jgi:Fe-S cluster biogenesis protein NfuA/nitrite reductase/ring-hydroxylating ferredoxin subunit
VRSEQSPPGELLDRVQELTARLDEHSDEGARALAEELVGAVIALYGDGLRRIMEAIAGARESGAAILDELAQDGAVASLLLIHDLYPVPLRERVLEALDTVRPYMESHGGDVELIALDDGVARLALRGSCNGCAASRATLELAIQQALDEHAPDLAGLEVEGLTDEAATPRGAALPLASSGGVGLPMVHAGPRDTAQQPPRWLSVDDRLETQPGDLIAIELDGAQLLIANVAGSMLAYRNSCAACGGALDGGELDGTLLCCPTCGAEFDLPRAGRAAGGDPLQLTPVPLLQSGGIRVAM